MPKSGLAIAFDTVSEALSDAGVTIEDMGDCIRITINRVNYRIRIEAEDNIADG